jgi:hypothetical protein
MSIVSRRAGTGLSIGQRTVYENDRRAIPAHLVIGPDIVRLNGGHVPFDEELYGMTLP